MGLVEKLSRLTQDSKVVCKARGNPEVPTTLV